MHVFPRAQKDQPLAISADGWNAAMDAAEWYRFQRLKLGGDGGVSGTGYEVLQVQNQSGADVPLFGVMGVGGVANFDANYPDRFEFGPLLQTTTAPPAAATDSGRFCIALEPIASGLVGRALFSGVCPCKVYRHSTDTTPPAFADVADRQSGYLNPSSSGARVLWCDAAPISDGPVWAVVRFPQGGGGGQVQRAVLAATLVAGTTPDPVAQVNFQNPDGSTVPGGPFYANNLLCESGAVGDQCVVVALATTVSSVACPYLLLRVVPKLLTTYQPGYDGNGNLTSVAQQFYGGGSSPAAAATNYATAQGPGDDLQRDQTTTTLSGAANCKYGTPTNLSATVSPATSGAYGNPTGVVTFYDWYGLSGTVLGTATLSGGTGTAAGSATATLTVTIGGGNHTIVVVYGGDSNYNASQSSGAKMTVTPATPKIAVSSSGASTYGGYVTLTATLTYPGTPPANPTGLVTFSTGGNQMGIPARVSMVSSGGMGGPVTCQASIVLNNLPPGNPLTITANYGGDGNYASASGSGSQVVNKATITVTPDSQTMTYGSTLPPLTYTMSGFVLSDSQYSGAVNGSPSITSNGSPTSSVGTYTISGAAGSLTATNYVFNYVTASLFINPASLWITANDATMVHGTSVPALTCSIVGIMNGDNITATASTTATNSSPAGTYTITPAASGSALSNYTLTLNQGTLTVT